LVTSWKGKEMLNAHYKTNPQAYIRKVVVTNKSKLSQLSAQAEVMPLASLKLKVKYV
jgi:hypothetical protein